MKNYFSRRVFLLASTSCSILAAGVVFKYKNASSSESGMTTLQAIIDTIIPVDEYPGALEVGVESKLMQYASAYPQWEADIPWLVEQLDELALGTDNVAFNALNLSQREYLLGSVLKLKFGSRLFISLELVRQRVNKWYYTSAAGLASLAYLPPSQYPAYSTIRKA